MCQTQQKRRTPKDASTRLPSAPSPMVQGDMQLLKSADVARMLSVTKQTLADWRHRKVGPKYYKLPGVRYKLADIIQWQEQQAVATAGAPGSFTNA